MRKLDNLKWSIAVGLTAVFLGALLFPFNRASAKPPTSGSSPLVIPAADFVSDGYDPDSVFFPFGGGYFQGTSSNYGCMEAPVSLPNGARIEQVFASVYDNDSARGISIHVRRVDNFSGGTDTLASMSTTAANAFAGVQVISDLDMSIEDVTYPDYSYYVTTCLGSSDIRIYSVRIYYSMEEEFPWIIFMPALLGK